MQVIPAVDVLDGEVVRLRQGRFDDVTTYGSDPAVVARSWIEEGADLVHVVDLAGARSGRPDRALWARLSSAGVVFQIGGGVRSVEIGREALISGAQRVVLGSTAIWEPEVAAQLVEEFGPERVVAALDVRDGRAMGSAWKGGGQALEGACESLVEAGVTWILATGIDRDGMMTGPDVLLLERIRVLAPYARLIASGGVADLGDIERLQHGGYEAVVIGRALYEGRFSLANAFAVASTDNSG